MNILGRFGKALPAVFLVIMFLSQTTESATDENTDSNQIVYGARYSPQDPLADKKRMAERVFSLYSLPPDKRDKKEILYIGGGRAEFWYWKVLGSETGPLPLDCQALTWLLRGRYRTTATLDNPAAKRFFEIFPNLQTLTLVLFDNQFHTTPVPTSRGKYRVYFKPSLVVIPYMKLTITREMAHALSTDQLETDLANLTNERCKALSKKYLQTLWVDPRLQE